MKTQQIALMLGPLLACVLWWCLPKWGMETHAASVVAAAAWMLIWWVLEAVPIGVTSVLPIAIFPIMGIASVADTTAPYGSQYVFLFFGGFLIALALERWELHRRFALSVLVAAGGRPIRLIGGFMLATAALSMWISNTATTLMMLPIAASVLSKVDRQEHPNFAPALLLGTAYAANLGGIATLIGTPPNVAMVGIMEEQFDVAIPFMEWTLMAMPFSVLMLCIVFILLTRVLTPISNEPLKRGMMDLRQELKALGPWKSGERRVAWIFGLTGLFWISRRALEVWFMWELNDASIAMLAGISLFIIPSGDQEPRPLLVWSDTAKLPWEILLLFGGGLTLAGALNSAGVLSMIAQELTSIEGLNSAILILLFAAVALMLTEVMSNLALTVVMVPVVAQVALQWEINPLLLVVPVTLASSCAFMLPMATPPNAIIFGSGRISMKQMASVGFFLNVIAALLTWGWGCWVLPSWTNIL
ncbi:MAG: SLC13 family permease [Bacteroidetes bacterium]|nr:SLC13 family permease [Bacteroidota bacterium]MDA1336273.1 SLC13 family permease [Bacteroidota bacterium]